MSRDVREVSLTCPTKDSPRTLRTRIHVRASDTSVGIPSVEHRHSTPLRSVP